MKGEKTKITMLVDNQADKGLVAEGCCPGAAGVQKTQ
jgi:hypothetical protein